MRHYRIVRRCVIGASRFIAGVAQRSGEQRRRAAHSPFRLQVPAASQIVAEISRAFNSRKRVGRHPEDR